jgi:hypothetical protein
MVGLEPGMPHDLVAAAAAPAASRGRLLAPLVAPPLSAPTVGSKHPLSVV